MKVLFDTNVLIGFLRDPGRRMEFETRLRWPLFYMSSVVGLELFAGCRTPHQKKALAGLVKPFEKAGRLLTPDHGCFPEAGRVLAALGTDGIGTAHLRQLTNDVLIAVSAARAGIVVVTENVADFDLIGRHTPVRYLPPSATPVV